MNVAAALFSILAPLQGTQLSDCRMAYDQRNISEKAIFASQCFNQWLEENPSADPENIHAATRDLFLSLSWNFVHQKSYSLKRTMTNVGLKRSQAIVEADVTSGVGFYWKAVFQSFDCRLRDGDATIPKCFLGKKEDIIQNLSQAMKFDANVHGFGPHRVYGILMREMPKIVGGSKETSEKFLKEAYERDPSYSINHIEYAVTLRSLKKYKEMRRVLQLFMNNDCRTMDPKRLFECEEDHVIAKDMLN